MSRGQTLFAGVCPLLSFLPIFRTAAHTALQHPNMSHDTMVSKSNHSFRRNGQNTQNNRYTLKFVFSNLHGNVRIFQ